MELTPETQEALFNFLLRTGDDALILGHRLSEWCAHGPILEEDIALSNIALDCIGQATLLLKLAGIVEGKGRSEDGLAYFRDAKDFRNVPLVEQLNGDFGRTIVRQLYFSAYAYLFFGALTKSTHGELKGIAEKSVKEIEYHLRHSRQWVLRLGDGTEESHKRVAASVKELWPYASDMFVPDEGEAALIAQGIIPDRSSLKGAWSEMIVSVLTEATLTVPQEPLAPSKRSAGGSELLDALLIEMQGLARAHPGAAW